MGTEPGNDITKLLQEWSAGDEDALDHLMEVIYGELKQIASGYMFRERAGHTLQATALVHETYFRLIEQHRTEWRNRKHLYGIAAQLMRRILVDHARAQSGSMRGGHLARVELDHELIGGTNPKWDEILSVSTGLEKLSKLDTRKAQVLELRYFGGLQVQEIAKALDVSIPTVNRLWRSARAWLRHWLEERPSPGQHLGLDASQLPLRGGRAEA